MPCSMYEFVNLQAIQFIMGHGHELGTNSWL